MNPHTFKVILTIWLSIGLVTGTIGQLINGYMFLKGKITKATFHVGVFVNIFFIYGIWHWL